MLGCPVRAPVHEPCTATWLTSFFINPYLIFFIYYHILKNRLASRKATSGWDKELMNYCFVWKKKNWDEAPEELTASASWYGKETFSSFHVIGEKEGSLKKENSLSVLTATWETPFLSANLFFMRSSSLIQCSRFVCRRLASSSDFGVSSGWLSDFWAIYSLLYQESFEERQVWKKKKEPLWIFYIVWEIFNKEVASVEFTQKRRNVVDKKNLSPFHSFCSKGMQMLLRLNPRRFWWFTWLLERREDTYLNSYCIQSIFFEPCAKELRQLLLNILWPSPS